MEKKVLVVDLDGTLYTINTFHYFLKFLISFSLSNFKIRLFISLIWYMFLRGFRLVAHDKMKYSILKNIEPYKIDYNGFVKSLETYKRNIAELNNPEFDIKVLATAAPSCYANIIAKNEQFNACLATGFPEKVYHSNYENKGEVKKTNVLKYLQTIEDSSIDTFITDHLDDLPLMKLAHHVIVYAPNQFLEAELKKSAITFKSRV